MEVSRDPRVGANHERHARLAELPELVRERRNPAAHEREVRERGDVRQRLPDVGDEVGREAFLPARVVQPLRKDVGRVLRQEEPLDRRAQKRSGFGA